MYKNYLDLNNYLNIAKSDSSVKWSKPGNFLESHP